MSKNQIPCGTTECDRYSKEDYLKCKACLGLVMHGCRKYTTDPTEKAIQIQDCMDSPMPKNGR